MPATTRTVPTIDRRVRLAAPPERTTATSPLTAAVVRRRPVLVRASGATAAAAL